MTAVQQLLTKMRKAAFPRSPPAEDHQAHLQQAKSRVKTEYRPPWKSSGRPQLRDQVPVLRNKQLSEWQIERMPLSKRSYCHPKNGRGFKPWPRGKEFSKCDSRDGGGHLPFLYESEVGKLETMRTMIGQATFLPVSTTSGYFGTRRITSSRGESSGPRKNRSCGR